MNKDNLLEDVKSGLETAMEMIHDLDTKDKITKSCITNLILMQLIRVNNLIQ